MTIAGQGEGNLTGSFAGLRVLDFSTTIAGPHCTRMLADTGAEVIKVETSEGETMRTRPPLRNHCSTAFGQLNIGKNSVVLDLKSPDGVEAVRRLVATCDVLVENFRPGVMKRLKLDYDSLRALNPKLIYCSISGYGQTGPSVKLQFSTMRLPSAFGPLRRTPSTSQSCSVRSAASVSRGIAGRGGAFGMPFRNSCAPNR
ncbi:Formyl-CoA:oxalate CoA-transferase [subsurface metagenome]